MDNINMKETAASIFDRYPQENKVFVTSDGQAFFDEAHAKNHAAAVKGRGELDIQTFRRNEAAEDAEDKEAGKAASGQENEDAPGKKNVKK